MNIIVDKLVDHTLLRAACDSTRHPGQTPSTATLEKMYRCRHSPIRTQMFYIQLMGIPTFVSVHLVRHKHGVEHFVESNRDDRGGPNDVTRLTPVNHSMLVNAEALINMSRKRLCYASHKTTVGVFARLRNAIRPVDPDLADNLYPECVACGYCPELKPCTAGPLAVIRAHRDTWPVRERARLAEEASKQKIED